MGTTASWFVGDTVVISNDHDLDPWVLSAGVSYRF
ncbi:MAG: OmpW family outer membrane protein [Pseudomonadota bacterium]